MKSNKGKAKRGVRRSAPDLREVSEILEFMEAHNLDEFEYENGDVRIRLRKAQSHSSAPFRAMHSAPEIVVAYPATASPAAPEPAGSVAESSGENLHVIKSPIVGTFYSSPTPGADPFVRPGDHVDAGRVLCIIEAMKLMNEIETDVAGEVMRVFVENGQPVEYGEPLFAIHPSRKQ
ncbi:MAG TPA: acetyl-CoA carboxylase biotin carboxyl carrier protein [Candidatus Acidoferrales bacterium]|nr:acetyl-CoA carboxylase biotin carboxyl carrier protein [Candidatus Acidoferrales bacterium]